MHDSLIAYLKNVHDCQLETITHLMIENEQLRLILLAAADRICGQSEALAKRAEGVVEAKAS